MVYMKVAKLLTPSRSTARLSDDIQAEIVRLSLRQTSQREIARRLNVSRMSVNRCLKRTRAALAITQDVEQDRAEAIAVYREIQRTAWSSIEGGRSPALLLAEVRLAQARIDTLHGLPAGPDDPLALFAAFRRLVLDVVRTEAPELAPVIAQRLVEAVHE